MKIYNEYQLISILNSPEAYKLTRQEVYKACVGFANNGNYHKEELNLIPEEIQLLQIRRLMHFGNYGKAKLEIKSLEEKPLSDFYKGEVFALSGILSHLQGHISEGFKSLYKSAELFLKSDEQHRYLRSRINSSIVTSDLNSYISGDLYSLEQLTRREEKHDLLGHILRGKACELINNEKLQQAESAISEAILNYQLSGAPEDLSLALCLKAIIEILSNDYLSAQESISKANIKNGKVQSYYEIYKTLSENKLPTLHEGHPLSLAPWKSFQLKRSSVTGKIVLLLQKKPMHRDELIVAIWGVSALDLSYNNRLYTAISNINKSGSFKIVFDGEFYCLL